MPVKLNTEFNYRYQVEGNTPWEKIKQLHGFLEGRKRAAVLEQVSELKYQALHAEIEHLKSNGAAQYIILTKQAELLEADSFRETEKEAYELNHQEIKILEKVMAELYAIVEPTRCAHPDGTPFTDEEMYELNAANEFTAMIGKEIYAEIAANGRPSPAKVRNAMSNPHTFTALQHVGLLPEQMQYVEGAVNPLKIELVVTRFDQLGNSSAPSSLFLKNNEEDNTSEKSL
jgi:hypothetical protein